MRVTAPITSFSGGVNNWVSPLLLSGDSAVEIHNADVSSAAIRSKNGPAAFSGVLPPACQYLTSDRSLVKLNEAWHWSNNVTGELSSSLGYLGVEPPENVPAVIGGDPGSKFTGTYLYTCTYVTQNGYESAPYFPAVAGVPRWAVFDGSANPTAVSYATFSIMRQAPGYPNRYGYLTGERVQFEASVWECVQTCTRSKVNGALPAHMWPGAEGQAYWKDVTSDLSALTGYATITVVLPSPDSGPAVTTRLYRTAAGGADFYLLAELPIGTTQYVDATDDVELLKGLPLETMDCLPPVYRFFRGHWERQGGYFLTTVNGIGWLAVGDCVYFSQPGNLHAWKILDFIRVSGDVTALAPSGDSLLVLTAARAYLVTGTSLSDMSVRDLHASEGCTDWRTVASLHGSPMWMSGSALAAYTGSSDLQRSEVRRILDGVFRFSSDPVFCVAYRDAYLAQLADGTAVSVDFRTGKPVVSTFDSSADFAYHDADTGILLLNDGGSWLQYEGGSALSWLYVSPQLSGDEKTTTRVKRWRRVRVDCDNRATVVPVAQDGREYAAVPAGGGIRWAYLPPGLVGRTLQLKVFGSGEMRSLEVEFNV